MIKNENIKDFLPQETPMLSHNLDSIALFGFMLAKQSLISCEHFQTELLELQPTAALIPKKATFG